MMDWFSLMNWEQKGLKNDRKPTNCVAVILRGHCKYDLIVKEHLLDLFLLPGVSKAGKLQKYSVAWYVKC